MPKGNILERAIEELNVEYCKKSNNAYVELARKLQYPKVIRLYEKKGSEVPNDFG